jgi:hypothetical protein
VSQGPLAVSWGEAPEVQPRAGTRSQVRLVLENAGSAPWRNGTFVAYHWLDDRGNPIVWDGVRTPAPPLEPGGRGAAEATVRAPIPPGRYRLAFDMVAEQRAWFSELGSPMLTLDLDVAPRDDDAHAELPEGVEPSPDWAERVRAAHGEGFAVVAGAIEWDGGTFHRRPKALAPYAPGVGRVPGFSAPLLCPSVVAGVHLDRLEDVAGLPAYAAPRDEPWLYDGRIVLRARPRSDRRSP